MAVIHHFTCVSLTVGSWRRKGQSAMDLVVFYSPEKGCVTYYINNDSAGYKIEYPFSYIKNITLENGDIGCNAEGASQGIGGLVVELTRPPNFFMDSSGSGGFYQCGDFTEDLQASHVLVHHLGGHPKVLSGQLARLVSLESFQNRHSAYDINVFAASAPVSPIGHRPASQPNHMVHPHLAMFDNRLAPGVYPPRGHKRQRSRSVPAAVDLSALRQPMPSFLIQPEPSPYVPNPDIFAPVPQSAAPPMGAHLSIDTSATYGMDVRQYPMSATTINSPSDFGTPAFFSTAAASDAVSAPTFAPTPYAVSFSHSPMAAPPHSAASVSPMPSVGHADPVIANQSPPLTSFGHDAHGDMAYLSHDRGVPDDALQLPDLYGKQPLDLPFRSALEEGASDLDVHHYVSYGTMDVPRLSPEHQHM